jgi:hypothetical protein
MASRLDLQTLLETVVQPVYFQPPSNEKMQYPCILYAREGSETRHADDRLYMLTKRYQVTVIDRDPDSSLPDLVEGLPLCSMDRKFVADGLNHYVFTLFF